MAELFLKLIELLREFIAYLLPFAILGDDEVGLIRRRGIYNRDMEPGINWKIPVLESHMTHTSARDTNQLVLQTLTTADGDTVVVRGILSYSVTDARRYILDHDSADGVLNDMGCTVLARLVPRCTTAEVLFSQSFTRKFREQARVRGYRIGVYVHSAGLVDRAKLRAYRIVGN
jgi:regulator of protease activity HflC (stomatin/prohibitin superfamily)